MLALGRKQGQSIVIEVNGEEVRIVNLSPRNVRLGIVAARHIGVVRGELLETKKEKKGDQKTFGGLTKIG
jgi:carbon storage regulator CsrA